MKNDLKAAQAKLEATQIKTVHNSHQAGLSIDNISLITGLTKEEIMKILEQSSAG